MFILKALFWLVLIVFIAGLLLSIWLRFFMKKVQKNLNERLKNYGKQEQKKEGDVTITRTSPGKTSGKSTKGDYIDFEEIK
jgi:3-deoxy-D-manno-octulosonic-acid transferase